MKIVASCIHKGGTGKTTCAVHLAHYLASLGNRVLMADCDTQGNATQVFLDDEPGARGVSALFEKKPGDLDVFETNAKNIFILPADEGLTEIDGYTNGEERRFRTNLRALAAEHAIDYVVIDTPPTLQMGMLAPLVAADFAFSPFKPDSFGFRGVGSLTNRIEQIREQHNPSLVYLGLLINLWNRRNVDQNGIVEAIEENLGRYVIPHKVGDRAAIARVAFSRTPVWAHKTGAAGVAAREMRAALSYMVQQMEKSA